MDLKHFLERLWEEYVKITPQAKIIKDLFENKYNYTVNDHIAFRTFNLSPISIGEIEHHFFNLGYHFDNEYEFEKKKLYARSYVHQRPDQPMIFLSQLLTQQLSEKAQKIIYQMVYEVDEQSTSDISFFYSGTWWEKLTSNEYNLLLSESEYAAWLSVMGMRANHFTLRVPSIIEALDLVEANHFKLNLSGGKVKGSSQVYLEQGSTIADQIEYEFRDGLKTKIPTCYYEFAQRYDDLSGKMYRGFVTNSADKIFESTNRGN